MSRQIQRSDELGLVIFQEFSEKMRDRISGHAGSAFEKMMEEQARTMAVAAWGGTATAIAAAINPIAGAVVGVIAGIVTMIFDAFKTEVKMLPYTAKFGYNAFMNWVLQVDYLVSNFLKSSFDHLELNPGLSKEKVALAANDLLRKMMIYKIDPIDRNSIDFWEKISGNVLLDLQQTSRNQDIAEEKIKEITYKLYMGVLNQYLYRLYLIAHVGDITLLYDIDPEKIDINRLRTIYYMTTSFILLQSLLDKKYLLLREITKFAFLHSLSRGYLISISDLEEHKSKGQKYFEVYSLFVVDRFTLVLADRLAKFLQENPQLIKKKRLDIQLSSGAKVRVDIDPLLDALRLKSGGKYLVGSFTDIENFLNKKYPLAPSLLVPSDYFLNFLNTRFFFSYNNWCYDRVNQFMHDLVHRIAVEVIDWDKLVDLCVSDINKREILVFLLYGSFWSWINSIYHLWDWGNRDTPPFPIIYIWWKKRDKLNRKAIGNNLFVYEDTAIFENTRLRDRLQIPFTFDVIECIEQVPVVKDEQVKNLNKRKDCLLYPYNIVFDINKGYVCKKSDYYIISTWLGIGWSNFLLSLKYPIISSENRYVGKFKIDIPMGHYYTYPSDVFSGVEALKIHSYSKLNWFGEISKIGLGEYKVKNNKALGYDDHTNHKNFWHILDYTSSDTEYWFSVSSASEGNIGPHGEPISYLKDFIWLYPNVFLIGSYYDFYSYIFEAYGTESLGYKIRCHYNIATESLGSVLQNAMQAFNKWILALKETKAARTQVEAKQKTSISRVAPTTLTKPTKPTKPTAFPKPTKPISAMILPLILIGSGIILLQKKKD